MALKAKIDPSEAPFVPDLQACSPVVGHKIGANLAGAVGSQPVRHRSDRLLSLGCLDVHAKEH